MEASLYAKLEGEKVRCDLCAHRCVIPEGKRGLCGVRENRGGTLYSLVYGRAVSTHVDPIEKKPLFNFLPGSLAFSVATAGCNMTCLHCQNADISQSPRVNGRIMGRDISPRQLVEEAQRQDCRTIAYTYTEPTIFFDYALDTARLGADVGLKNVFVTNGYMTAEALEMIAPVLSAANVDLKSFRDDFYRKICGARLQPVLDTIRKMFDLGIWLEVTTLVIPEHNDSDEELESIARYVAAISPEIPWHVSAFYPTYRLTSVGPTPASTLRRARKIGQDAGLQYVYTGNIPGDDGENTYCPGCGKKIVERIGYRVGRVDIREGKCAFCGSPVAGVWE
ncbi:MAG: AmmeMemoRadiSam system radical SAM enzyme [Candidatus Euphemobacter frigidus]|nr:AmmeMemoRadiSam system radical SAM enzyme [Candidatus Euphemobacter frigidus]MDP8276095.1 AmmeMemoRadiSam system radical SAM enzyme [Candidatus Euphemobacter frigidus]